MGDDRVGDGGHGGDLVGQARGEVSGERDSVSEREREVEREFNYRSRRKLKQRKSTRTRWYVLVAVVLLVAGSIGIAVVLAGDDDGGDPDDLRSSPTSLPSTPTTGTEHAEVELRVQNDFRGGAWSRTSATDGSYYSENERPPNGREWLPNGTAVTAACWVDGEQYQVQLFTTTEAWSHWARLTDGAYLQMSLFSETTALQSEDIPGFQECP